MLFYVLFWAYLYRESELNITTVNAINRLENIEQAVLAGGIVNKADALFLYKNAPLWQLMKLGHELRNQKTDARYVGWIIDRNVNITNGCFSQCSF